MNINERIKAVRKDLKLTQIEFAAKLFMTNDAISNIERGNNPPAARTIDQICSTFNVSKEWLVDGVGDMYLLPLDEDAELFKELIALGRNRATVQSIKAILRMYIGLDEDERAALDEAITAAVLRTKKDPE